MLEIIRGSLQDTSKNRKTVTEVIIFLTSPYIRSFVGWKPDYFLHLKKKKERIIPMTQSLTKNTWQWTWQVWHKNYRRPATTVCCVMIFSMFPAAPADWWRTRDCNPQAQRTIWYLKLVVFQQNITFSFLTGLQIILWNSTHSSVDTPWYTADIILHKRGGSWGKGWGYISVVNVWVWSNRLYVVTRNWSTRFTISEKCCSVWKRVEANCTLNHFTTVSETINLVLCNARNRYC
jgi:hypothetical protein